MVQTALFQLCLNLLFIIQMIYRMWILPNVSDSYSFFHPLLKRCCPSRASLLTGKYPHQAGIGHMVYDASVGPEYQGYLRSNDDNVTTIAEMLQKQGGYATFMSGKWHVGGEYPPDASDEWVQSTMGDDTHPIPTQRGFDKFLVSFLLFLIKIASFFQN